MSHVSQYRRAYQALTFGTTISVTVTGVAAPHTPATSPGGVFESEHPPARHHEHAHTDEVPDLAPIGRLSFSVISSTSAQHAFLGMRSYISSATASPISINERLRLPSSGGFTVSND